MATTPTTADKPREDVLDATRRALIIRGQRLNNNTILAERTYRLAGNPPRLWRVR